MRCDAMTGKKRKHIEGKATLERSSEHRKKATNKQNRIYGKKNMNKHCHRTAYMYIENISTIYLQMLNEQLLNAYTILESILRSVCIC